MNGTDPPRCRFTSAHRRPTPTALVNGAGAPSWTPLPQQSLNAYENQCAPANPRMPMLDDMQKIMRTACCWCARGRPDTDKGRTALA